VFSRLEIVNKPRAASRSFVIASGMHNVERIDVEGVRVATLSLMLTNPALPSSTMVQ
jgi:hypothetical protein